MVGRPSASDAAASIARAAAATRVLEHGVGEDVAPLQKQANTPPATGRQAATLPVASLLGSIQYGTTPGDMLDELQRTFSNRSPELDKAMGEDIRGRQMSEDLREFVRILRKELPAAAAPDADKSAWVKEQRQRFTWLQDYWSEYPALTHNREMFADFLAKNHMQPTTSHGPNVLEAESELRAALNSKQPTEEWPQRARALRDAYISERSAFVKSSRSAIPPQVVFSPRASRCPAAATTTTGTTYPRVGSSSASLLDYWPPASRRLGEEGTVMAALRISPTGCVIGMSIVGSSGSDMLDGAVLKYLESVEFIPAGPDGKPVQSEVMLPIVFKLQQ
jgi:TonB family protein